MFLPCKTSASFVTQGLLDHRPRSRRLLAISIAGLALLCARTAPSIVVTDGGPFATRLTLTQGLAADELAAFQLQGRFRGFIGTPISEDFFVTAQHIGIAPPDAITFDDGPNAGTYSILTWFDDPETDLRLVQIDGVFADWAPLYAASDEPGRTAIVFGRGGPPNGQVFVGQELKGWTTAFPDGAIAWGRNVIDGTFGKTLYARFDINGLPEEAGLSIGDSGGAWFIRDTQGLLRLAALSLAVTGPFQFDAGGVPDGNPFEAPLFDTGGLWVGEPGNEVFLKENPVPTPGVGLSTRISNRLDWIAQTVGLIVVDSDGDGIPDEQDNCPFRENPDQLDNGGLGFSNDPDGIGNACQCGDVTGEGQVNDTDAAFIKRYALGLSAPLFLEPANCDVSGEGLCNGIDATLIRQAASGNVSALFGQNCPNAVPR